MEEYARNVPDELAEKRIAQINKAGQNIYFAWSGGIGRMGPHYYCVQTPSFLIELDGHTGRRSSHPSVRVRRPATSARTCSASTTRPVINKDLRLWRHQSATAWNFNVDRCAWLALLCIVK